MSQVGLLRVGARRSRSFQVSLRQVEAFRQVRLDRSDMGLDRSLPSKELSLIVQGTCRETKGFKLVKRPSLSEPAHYRSQER